MSEPEQVPLDLGHRPAMGRADFIVAPCNAHALAVVERPAEWPEARLALTGPAGAGKTHLARVFAQQTGAPTRGAGDLDPPPEPGPLVLEDLDRTLQPGSEEALLHLLNVQAAARAPLLLTARTPPARWPVALPDLASRLGATALARIEPPDDALLGALLAKLFADRGLRCPPAVTAYLARRIERSHAAAVAVVETMDRLALREGREISRALAARALAG